MRALPAPELTNMQRRPRGEMVNLTPQPDRVPKPADEEEGGEACEAGGDDEDEDWSSKDVAQTKLGN